jgi:hypothetical protein
MLCITARYPSHKASKWLDSSKEHSRDIDNLHSTDGDFHHGFNSGVLAASRMFKDHADVSHVDSDSVSVKLFPVASTSFGILCIV